MMTTTMIIHPRLYDIFHYNRWRGVEVPEIHACFTELTTTEKKKLKKGERIWLDLEPYHLNGKVYGYSGVEIKRKQVSGRYLGYIFESPQHAGGFSVAYKAIWKLTDEQKLEELVKLHGDQITQVY